MKLIYYQLAGGNCVAWVMGGEFGWIWETGESNRALLT